MFSSLPQLLLLGVVQGITEFLPVSSSGHTALLQYFLNLPGDLSLDIFLNTATFVAVLIYFRHHVRDALSKWKFIALGTIPAVIAGLFFKNQIESTFGDPKSLAPFFLLTSIFLISTRFVKPKDMPLTLPKAFLIGLAQAFAILPSLSRSGATIATGLLLGLSPATAFTFSFYLLIPASAGALLLDIKKQIHLFSGVNLGPYLISFLITAIIGYISLGICRKFLANRKIWYFGVYTLLVAIFCFIFIR